MILKTILVLFVITTLLLTANGQNEINDFVDDGLGGSTLPKNCDDLNFNKQVNSSGEYFVHAANTFRKVFCVMNEAVTQKNWLIIQRRVNAELDFYRNWNNYTEGFGDMSSGSFWLGLEKIHAITSLGDYLLRIELLDFNNRTAWVESNHFSISGPEDNYRFNISKNKKDHRGSAGQIHRSFMYNNGQPFSTFDKDNDKWSGSCAAARRGGWWFNRCTYINLNGKYITNGGDPWIHEGVYWYWLKRSTYSLKKVEMMIRPL